MFNDVKQLKIEEVELLLAQLKAEERAMHQKVHTLKMQLDDWEAEYPHSERNILKLNWQKENEVGPFYGKMYKFKLRKRLFDPSARKAYQAYREKLSEYEAVKKDFSTLTDNIEQAKQELAQQIANSGILQKISETEHLLIKIHSAKKLSQLNMTETEAVAYLKSKGIEPVWDQSDQEITDEKII